MENKWIKEFSDSLYEAEKSRTPVKPLTSTKTDLSLEEAYQIQNFNAQRAMKQGRKLIGYKVGLTSKVVQQKFGVDEPDFGHLFHDMLLLNDTEVDLSQLIQPKIEGEVAFVMGKDLSTSGVTPTEVIRAVDYVTCSFEIVDSRIENWKIKGADTIADNGSSSRFVLSPKKTLLSDLDFSHVGMALSKNGVVEVTGSASAVMGNPIHAVAFVANELGRFGKTIHAGDVILSGSLSGMLEMKDSDFFSCEMWRLGTVNVTCRNKGESK